nr:ATP-binding protein [Phaeovibrio sulfidiphilus]
MIARERAFIDGAAHELRTPLAGLRIQTELAALSEGDPDTQREALGNVLSGIDHVTDLAEQLIEFSRLDALRDTGASLPLSPVPWADEVARALEAQEARIRGRHLEVQVSTDPHSRLPEGHPLLVALLVRNLVTNAALYTPEGGTIRIRLDSGGLEVANTARPLPREDAARLGESFFRPPGQAQQGSGLGLSIVRRVAELHGMECRIIAPDGASAPAEFRVCLVFPAGAAGSAPNAGAADRAGP